MKLVLCFSACWRIAVVLCAICTAQCTGELESITPATSEEELGKRGLEAPTDLSASVVSSNQIELRWMDNSRNESGFEVERASSPSGPWTKVGITTKDVSTYTYSGLEASMIYFYQVRAYNASRASGYSNVATAMTSGGLSCGNRGCDNGETCITCSIDCGACPTNDTTPPSVSIVAPSEGATVSGTVMVSVSASDNVAVAGVHLSSDGADVGSEDTTAPYVLSFDSASTSNGRHTLTAVARDAAGNTSSSSITIVVDNSMNPTGSTYYVAANGSDSNPCSQSSPCQTIDKGVSMLSAGDTLYLREGTYTDQSIGYPDTNPLPSGTSWSNPVTVSAYPGETVVLPNKGITLLGPDEQYIIINGINTVGFFADCDTNHIRLQDSVLDGANARSASMLIQGCAQFIEVINVEIKNSPNYGMYWFGQDSLFDGLNVHDNCAFGLHIYHHTSPENPEGGNDVHRNTLRNSWIHDNDTGMWNGQQGCGDPGSDFGGTIVTAGTGNKVYNNVFSGNWVGLVVGSRCNQCEVYNNTIYGNDDVGLEIATGGCDSCNGANSIVTNNIVYNNGSVNIQNANPPGLQIHHNLTSDPQFVNASANDFRLQSHSLAIDAGVDLSAQGVTTDIAGTSRPQGNALDIGAYEYAGTSP